MAHFDSNSKEEKQHILIAWLIVVFAFVLLFLIWQAHGIF